jgi:uncharacterized protein involved in type VI secretion and phage assembly
MRVIRVKHVFDANERYYNEFDAVSVAFGRIPCPDIDIPPASALPARVVANEDPDGLGKVQVKFDFDEHDCRYWLPMMMPEAGGPENRGYIFVPEVDDKVLVSFFNGNPEFPFVMGSMFHGKNGKGIGGGAGNHIKSMRDKAGSEVVLNTQDGSTTVKDKNGSDSTIKLDGSKNISVKAGKTANVNVGESQSVLKMDKDGIICLTANTKIMLKVGENTVEINQQGIIMRNKDGNCVSIIPEGITNIALVGKIETVAEAGSILIASISDEANFTGTTDTNIGKGSDMTYLCGGEVEINQS